MREIEVTNMSWGMRIAVALGMALALGLAAAFVVLTLGIALLLLPVIAVVLRSAGGAGGRSRRRSGKSGWASARRRPTGLSRPSMRWCPARTARVAAEPQPRPRLKCVIAAVAPIARNAAADTSQSAHCVSPWSRRMPIASGAIAAPASSPE